MTLIVGTTTAEFAIIGADRRVQTGQSTDGPFTPGEGDKLFQVDGCSVASFGTGPAGVDVPEFIRLFIGQPWEPQHLAGTLFDGIKKFADPGDFGLFVAGSGVQELELWEVTKKAQRCVKLDAGIVHERENVIGVQGERSRLDCKSMIERALEILRQGHLTHSSSVGPPYEISLVRFGQQPVASRHAS